jgi:hypothetical protein
MARLSRNPKLNAFARPDPSHVEPRVLQLFRPPISFNDSRSRSNKILLGVKSYEIGWPVLRGDAQELLLIRKPKLGINFGEQGTYFFRTS